MKIANARGYGRGWRKRRNRSKDKTQRKKNVLKEERTHWGEIKNEKNYSITRK